MNAACAVGFLVTGRPARCIISAKSPFPSCSPSISRLGPPGPPAGGWRSRGKGEIFLIPLTTLTLLHPARSRPASHLWGFSHIGICRRIFCSALVLLPDRNVYSRSSSFVSLWRAKKRTRNGNASRGSVPRIFFQRRMSIQKLTNFEIFSLSFSFSQVIKSAIN